MNRRGAAIAGIAALVLGAGGCAGDGGDGDRGGRERLTVYISVPLEGARGVEGRAIADGARLALANARGRVGGIRVRAVYLDDTLDGRWSLARSASNARRAAQDAAAIGYIGELDSGATRVSLPITNQAGIVQISPGSTAVDLTRLPAVGNLGPERLRPSEDETFARVVPDDEVQARAAAIWADRLGHRRAFVVSDGTVYGDTLSDAFSEHASGLGISVSGTRTGRQGTEALPQRLAAQAPEIVYLAATAERVMPLLVSGARTGADMIGPDDLLIPSLLHASTRLTDRLRLTSPFIDPTLLPPAGQRFVRAFGRRFGRPAAPAAAYGYEAMALLLDAIRRAGDDGDERDAVVDEVLSTRDRRSPLGTYSIDGNGDTTLDAVSGYRISDGLPVFPVRLLAPR